MIRPPYCLKKSRKRLWELTYVLVYGLAANKCVEQASGQVFSDNLLSKLVSRDEARVLEALVSIGSKAQQKELAKLTGLGKVKVHRIVRRLAKYRAVKIVKESRNGSIVQPDEELLSILRSGKK